MNRHLEKADFSALLFDPERDLPKNTHRWRRAKVGDPEHGRICACGNLKDQQALRCRTCYADCRRDENARTCACGGPKDSQSRQCKLCCDEAKRGVPVSRTPRPQPSSHPWRKPVVYGSGNSLVSQQEKEAGPEGPASLPHGTPRPEAA